MQPLQADQKNILFPEIEPYHTGFIKVSDPHSLYYEACGNPEGYPVVFLHGGPGGGVNEKYRRFFDPEFYRIILFDQRGAGKSLPHADLRENTTWDLVADIEKLRQELGIEKWLVFGGSWGSTLALSYAITHPDRASGLILRGIFLCRPEEIQWLYQEGASWLYPDVWEKYLAVIPENERHDMVKAYYARLTSEDPEVRLQAARVWSTWEAATSKLIPDLNLVEAFDEAEFALAFARIECHYFIHDSFFPSKNYLLENVDKIRQIPGYIVHGRYDVVCPVRSAWDLHRAWPEAQLEIVPDAGHSAMEPGILHQLIGFTEDFKLRHAH
ncbi:prolyl aminopeptidase [bacterium (Candidatus Blackallbacteria) CG17_big_fil_post_rev_8_21_14_2_50_48_46]|uniref:Proline iminopeptidase n=1 Tax=bacterium (Candidatus Blackallbacteria) CG17_big_fil_post_rev_8_21_14_2_50_48_46 TaxID=2014261 RepID=A0A2M7G4I7_9BACT|nr:MAG: prolyl aminopeptidase [bacterium (Candidatus Blackallbacteria) CG18_big_fil_WC_8_21_14_2_50_49_26]PIW16835.1 MAG: prolyl aminopeptidase [bacterium (Candidatus Blackallbacteria) CG17_big_fil_post_rev_8_21_14_2_50_48_46]PIW48032.1 MAG: prolyl aminopeptidase [bacterium (Candidatus Blackallbacteria) CG13_big_fil_rev_8_21_14_2_50_49_14]